MRDLQSPSKAKVLIANIILKLFLDLDMALLQFRHRTTKPTLKFLINILGHESAKIEQWMCVKSLGMLLSDILIIALL